MQQWQKRKLSVRYPVAAAFGGLLVVLVIVIIGLLVRGPASPKIVTVPELKSHTTQTTAPNRTIRGNTMTDQAKAVQMAYDAYLNSVRQQRTQSFQTSLPAIKPYLSGDLYARIQANYAQNGSDHDLVLCTQDFPSKLVAASDSSNPNQVYLNETFSQNISTPGSATLGDDGKITAVNCN